MFKNKNRKKGTGRYSDEFDDGDDDSDSDSDVRIGGLGMLYKYNEVSSKILRDLKNIQAVICLPSW